LLEDDERSSDLPKQMTQSLYKTQSWPTLMRRIKPVICKHLLTE